MVQKSVLPVCGSPPSAVRVVLTTSCHHNLQDWQGGHLSPVPAAVHAAEELALRSSTLPPLPLDLPPLAALQPAMTQQAS